jgi:hypothetical protein
MQGFVSKFYHLSKLGKGIVKNNGDSICGAAGVITGIIIPTISCDDPMEAAMCICWGTPIGLAIGLGFGSTPFATLTCFGSFIASTYYLKKADRR